MMKKYSAFFATLLLSVVLSSPIQAQTRSAAFAEFQAGLDNYMASAGFTGGYQWAITNNLSVGPSAGALCAYNIGPTPIFPVSLRAKYNFSSHRKSSFYAMAEAGYVFHVGDEISNAWRVSPSVGIEFKHLYLGLGYQFLQWEDDTDKEHGVTLKIGYTFGHGNHHEALVSKLRRQRQRAAEASRSQDNGGESVFSPHAAFKLEAGAGMGLTQPSISTGTFEPKFIGNTLFMRAVAQYRFTEHLAAGVGTGLETMGFHKSGQGMDMGNLHLPLFVRLQYTFKDEGDAVRPYVSCDVGKRFKLSGSTLEHGSAQGIVLEPTVGIAFHRWSAGLGYAFSRYTFRDSDTAYDSDRTTQGNAITLRAGYSF